MLAEVKPLRYGDLIEVAMNDGLFGFLRLHAVGNYIAHCVANTPQGFIKTKVPVNIRITDEYPPQLVVDGTTLEVGKSVSRSGLVITHKQ